MTRAGAGSALALACASLVTLAVSACSRPDDYVGVVREHIVDEPVQACCTSAGVGDGGAARLAKCKATAARECAFVRGATVKQTHLARIGEGETMVDVDVKGASGSGHCRFQVQDTGGSLQVENGACWGD